MFCSMLYPHTLIFLLIGGMQLIFVEWVKEWVNGWMIYYANYSKLLCFWYSNCKMIWLDYMMHNVFSMVAVTSSTQTTVWGWMCWCSEVSKLAWLFLPRIEATRLDLETATFCWLFALTPKKKTIHQEAKQLAVQTPSLRRKPHQYQRKRCL